VRIRWRPERHRGLVVGRSTTNVDDDPTVGECHLGRLTRMDDPSAEHLGVELTRPLHVV
jgi:hypothetical protein